MEESTEEGRQGTGQVFDMKVKGIKDDYREKKKCEAGSVWDLEKVVWPDDKDLTGMTNGTDLMCSSFLYVLKTLERGKAVRQDVDWYRQVG